MVSQLHTIRLAREDTSVPWGFRLEGGIDIGHAINIQHVAPGSVADCGGLRAGDVVVRLNRSETKWMRHDDAKMEIIRSGNDLEMMVQRSAVHVVQASAPVTMLPNNSWNKPSPTQTVKSGTVWQPKLIHSPQPLKNASGLDTRTSLEATNHDDSQGIGVSHNVSPLPFGHSPPAPGQALVAKGVDGRFRQIKHSSYNSPMGLYHKSNLDETFERTVGAFSGPGSQPSPSRPAGGAMARSDSGVKSCGSCGGYIRDVFVKVQGRVPMHPECLKCCKCGVGLRNVGYFYINEQLYCERHAKQAAPPPEPGMKPVVVYK
ncbi:hypothetical protein CRM22_005214 [Opisthorchis felineus]|uniref:PDZ domain-containing protein n=1 Tax=Opisthorchis felineus TaxID=147828 RepID=A0A4S2LSA4_OPIFE|nr:hypothetical protein CRM22_005214 [Opisthorchis felineus]